HHDGNAFGSVPIGYLVSFFELRGEGADGNQSEMGWHFRKLTKVRDFMVVDGELIRSKTGERQQTEAWQKSDNAVAGDEAGQSETEFGQFRIMSAHAAHSDKTDSFHVWKSNRSNKTAPATRLRTGTAKRAWAFSKWARSRQHSGMEMPPTMKAHPANENSP